MCSGYANMSNTRFAPDAAGTRTGDGHSSPPGGVHGLERHYRVGSRRALLRCDAGLFHDDAELVGLETVTSGRPAIAEFYAASIAAARPAPHSPPISAMAACMSSGITVRILECSDHM